jgi:DNA polymerase phi
MQTEILVEVILGFLSKPSTLQRKLSEQVFASFSSSLTPAGLKLLLDVLLTPETVSGAEDLFDHEMENAQEGEDGGEDEEGEGEDNDEEEVSESEGGEEDDDEAEDGMELDEDEDVVSNDGSNDDELTAALSAALGTTKELANGDDDSSDESLMDDDEMMAIDENLANIFRQRLKPNRAKEAKDTKQQMSTFKCKVIDLLDILVRNHSLLCLEMILPLLQVLRITKSETVHSKTITLLRKLAKAKELPESTGDLMGLLRKIHEDAAKARNKDGNVHSQLSIYIARIARKRGQEEEVIGVYAETMRKWIKNGKSMVRAGLFADWVNWCQSIRR